MVKTVSIIANEKSIKVDLAAGKNYFWCQSGLSQSQPFCGGSRAGTDITPLGFTAEKTGPMGLGQCRSSANTPFCDGTHATLGEPNSGDLAPASKSDIPVAMATAEEPTFARIHERARHGISKLGHHGKMGSMGAPCKDLPHWNGLQILPARMAREPLLDTVPVTTPVTIGSRAENPLKLDIPLIVSYTGFGALSEEAKTALARDAQMPGTGVRSGEGGMLPREKAEKSRHFYELASAKFGWESAMVERVQAFHFNDSHGAISPATFLDLQTPADFNMVTAEGRERSGSIPIGFKLSANHIEDDIDFALAASADYIVLNGRGGGTGAAPLIFRDHISEPTIPALARTRRHLDAISGCDVTLVIIGGLRMAKDFASALALGADAIALSNSAMQAVGWIAARMCNSNNCPVGVATQKPEFHKRLDVQIRPEKLVRYFGSSVELMQVLARACSHSNLPDFRHSDITTWKREMADLSGANFAGFNK